jgi:hypothetical protein
MYTNFISPEVKLYSVIGGASSFIIGGLYVSGVTSVSAASIVAMPAIALTLGVSYYSRTIIDFTFSGRATKCDNSHPLKQSLKEVVNSYDGFTGLDNIDLFIYRDYEVNAFACGFTQDQAAIYVSEGLIDNLGRNYSNNQLKAVVAHELGHISGGHIQINSAVKVLDIVGNVAATYLSNKIADSKNYKSKSENKSKNDKKDDKDLSGKSLDMAIWIGIKVFQKMGLSAVSRQLEYQADDAAVKAGLGKDLMEALISISRYVPKEDSFFEGIWSYCRETFSTHPSLANRLIAIDNGVKELKMLDHGAHVNIGWFDWFAGSLQQSISKYSLEHSSHFYQRSVLNDIFGGECIEGKDHRVQDFLYHRMNSPFGRVGFDEEQDSSSKLAGLNENQE